MEIQLYNSNQALSLIPKRDSEIAEALKTRMFKDIPEVEAYEIVKAVITKCYISARYESPLADELKIISDETMKVIKSRFGQIRENELQICFTRGIISEYGDFKGLSLITFIQFIKGYLKEDSRIKLTTPDKENNIPSDKEMYQIKKTNALNALNEFKINETCGRYAVVVYDFLSELKLIDFTQEEKNVYWAKAKEEYKIYLLGEKSKMMTMDEKKRIEKDYSSFLEGGKKDRLIVISKRLIVDDFFKSILFEEIDLAILIDPS
jgi:hypothetical protein